MKKIIIVDGNNYSMIAVNVSLRKGDYSIVNQVLLSMIKKLKRLFGEYEDYYVCFDSRGGTKFRKEINPEYKATRTYDKEKVEALERTRDIYTDNGFIDITLESTEADDTIFVLSKYLKEKDKDTDIFIVTRDKDLIQAKQEGFADHIWDPYKKEDMEIPDYKITRYKALIGDASDNISGVPGIGHKTAIKILSGEKILNEEQLNIYNKCLLLVDAKLNPMYESNFNKVKELLK